MIGTKSNAAKALESVYVYVDEYGDDCFSLSIEEDWSFLGNGAYRVALLGPDDVVYKVPYFIEENENAQEYDNFRTKNALIVSQSSGKCRLAKSHYFDNGVIAMEYVEKGIPTWVDAFYMTEAARMLTRFFSANGLFDFSRDNLWFDTKGRLTMVDYAA